MDTLREQFLEFLEKNFPRLRYPEIIVSDAFYCTRHDLGITLDELINHSKTAEDYQKTLENHFIQANRKTPKNDASTYTNALRYLLSFFADNLLDDYQKTPQIPPIDRKKKPETRIPRKQTPKVHIPRPSVEEVRKYLLLWDSLESYTIQESALNKLFFRTYPENKNIDDVLIKVCALNDFYSTNIFFPYIVAEHIVALNIDDRLQDNDDTLVNDIAKNIMPGGKLKNFFSFATKYCSHHRPLAYPIYDNFVDKILMHFMGQDGFASFKKDDLKDYSSFKRIVSSFRSFYGLSEFSFKEIDKYLWQAGKEYFPQKYQHANDGNTFLAK